MISASMVKELREISGAGMLDCKKALEATNGNMEEAITWLREKGISKAAKKQTRIAAEGLAHIEIKGNKAVIIEVNSETDFVAKNQEFVNLVKTIASTIIDNNVSTVEEALKLKAGENTLEELIIDKTSKIGEKISFRRFEIVEKEDTEVIAVENNVEEQEKVEEIQLEADIVKVKNTNIQEEPKKDPVVTQEKKVESSKPVEQPRTTPVITPKKTVEKETTTPVVETKIPEQPKEETKVEIKQPETPKCSDSKHGVGVGNSNKWFNSYNEAVSYYDNLILDYSNKIHNGQITFEEYNKQCPCGYEIWSCQYCGKWTLNYYKR